MLRPLARGAAAIAVALLLASCGAEDEPPPPDTPPTAMLDRAFDRLPASGRAQIGLEALLTQISTQPVTATLEGPFVTSGGSAIPSFDLDVEAEAGGFGVDGKLVSTGGDGYVVFFGENYRLGADRVAALNRRAPDVDPRTWFGPPRYGGTEEVESVDSYRIEAPLRPDEISADLQGLGLDSASMSAIRAGLSQGTIEAWVGADDGVIRRVRLDSEALGLDLVLFDLGEPQEIQPPPGGGFQPIEELLRRIPGL